MRRIQDKERLLQAKVKFTDVLTAKNKTLLKQYFFDDLLTKTCGTQAELDNLYTLIQQLEEIEWLKVHHICKFTNWECALLIKEGYFENLRFCIENNCITSRGRTSGYEIMKEKLEKLVMEKNLVPVVTARKSSQQKSNSEVAIDTKKLTKIINYINRNGGLTKEEKLILVKLLNKKSVQNLELDNSNEQGL